MDSNLTDNDFSNDAKLSDINKVTNYYNILHHPDITNFKVVEKEYKRHDAFFEKNNEYPLELLHIMKPKVKMLGDTTDITNKKYYIDLIQKLFRISEMECISKLNKFNGDIYKTIIFG